jgi:hypothetical protein
LTTLAGQVHVDGVVLIPADPGHEAITGLTLDIDHRGVVVTAGDGTPRTLGWDAVTGWRVDPYDIEGRPGAAVTVQTAGKVLHFAVPGSDPVAISHGVGQLALMHGGMGTAESAPVAPGEADRPAAEMAVVRRGSLEHWQPVLVTLLIVVLATAIALVLAQSAGAIHLPLLGGYGDQGSVVVPRP